MLQSSGQTANIVQDSSKLGAEVGLCIIQVVTKLHICTQTVNADTVNFLYIISNWLNPITIGDFGILLHLKWAR